jgi:hypothetical protein
MAFNTQLKAIFGANANLSTNYWRGKDKNRSLAKRRAVKIQISNARIQRSCPMNSTPGWNKYVRPHPGRLPGRGRIPASQRHLQVGKLFGDNLVSSVVDKDERKDKTFPACPKGGTYAVNALGVHAACSAHPASATPGTTLATTQ